MKHLSVREIVEAQKKRESKRHDAFDKILESSYNRVRKCIEVTRNVYSCLFEVPEFLIGYPLYDLNECLRYIIQQLQKNGFYVHYFFPRILYISWYTPQNQAAIAHAKPATASASASAGRGHTKVFTQPTRGRATRSVKASGKYVLDLS